MTKSAPIVRHIHEHRAPTDDSIRLAEEYRARALEKLIASYELTLVSNSITGKAYVFNDHTGYDFVVLLNINGQSQKFHWRLSTFDVMEGSQVAAEKFREACHRAITEQIAGLVGVLHLPTMRRS
jgi:hypothetical protein